MRKRHPPTGTLRKDSAKSELIFADVILRSATGKRVIGSGSAITPHNVKSYLPKEAALEEARGQFVKLGFEINLVAPTHITVYGPKKLFESVFRIRLLRKSAPYFKPPRKRDKRQVYYESSSTAKIPANLTNLVEAVEFPGPITYLVSSVPPTLTYDHLEVPDDVARDMDALKLHERGIVGAGVNLAMVDTGFLTPFHPYYSGKGYNIQPVVADPMDPNPNEDTYGHGTGISACALAVAPSVTYTVFKVYGINWAGAFSRAAAAAPDIITCSWAARWSHALKLSIDDAVARGIVVCFACGNGGIVEWPGSEPGVVSVGGAFIGNDDSIHASSYASSGTNATNPGRQCPDLCGIVGMAPRGIFIGLPTQPNSELDNGLSGGVYPKGDTTAADDGWAVFSGTSSATPMVAATAALVMQANPAAVGNPAMVRNALTTSCIDVTAGNSASGQPAGPGADLATGVGLVQAYRAVRATDIWIRDNPNSDVGLVPTHNRRPTWPPFAHWVSPDVKLFSAALANPSVDFDPTPNENPMFNQDNFVYIRIRNRGTQPAVQVNTRLYYADPATNLVFPVDWNDGQSGTVAHGSIQVGGAGTNLQAFPSIAPGGQTVLPQPFVWRPPDPTTATQTQTLPDGRVIGHFCLLVRLESADDPIIFAGGGQSSVINDNNIAMANQEVYSAPPGHPFHFTFYVKGRTEADGITKNEVLFDLSSLPRACVVMLRTNRKETVNARLVSAARTKDGIRLEVGKKLAGFVDLVLGAQEKVLVGVSIQMPARAMPNDYPVTVSQSSRGEPLGGLTLVARVRQ